jgi:hypothetical protein
MGTRYSMRLRQRRHRGGLEPSAARHFSSLSGCEPARKNHGQSHVGSRACHLSLIFIEVAREMSHVAEARPQAVAVNLLVMQLRMR